ncbi:MAG: 16S rRNA (guanine(966)-N(2))-methyltransferase RsmD [Cyanobacteria bacterium P01_F01_bin.150]
MALRIYGNRSLKTLPGKNTRPTPARVREALFNIWQGNIVDCRWLDLCAGSGAMGAEALCRGAQSVTGIEQASRACGVIQQNWQQVRRPDQQIRVVKGHILRQLPQLKGEQFDRIYFDPPYDSDLYEPVLDAIASLQLLVNGGEVAVEHNTNRSLPERIEAKGANAVLGHSLIAYRCKSYGLTSVTFYSGEER